MGQRSLQLNNTYTVNNDGSVVYHVSQMPPNANIFQPGPAFLYVTIKGIPSNGTYVIIGSGNIETQTLGTVTPLPANVRVDSASGSGSANGSAENRTSLSTGPLIAIIVGAIAVVGVLGTVFGVCLAKRRRASAQTPYSQSSPTPMGVKRQSDSSAFIPLRPSQPMVDHNWDGSTANLVSSSTRYSQYLDNNSLRGAHSGEFDPYYEQPPRMSTSAGPPRY